MNLAEFCKQAGLPAATASNLTALLKRYAAMQRLHTLSASKALDAREGSGMFARMFRSLGGNIGRRTGIIDRAAPGKLEQLGQTYTNRARGLENRMRDAQERIVTSMNQANPGSRDGFNWLMRTGGDLSWPDAV